MVEAFADAVADLFPRTSAAAGAAGHTAFAAATAAAPRGWHRPTAASPTRPNHVEPGLAPANNPESVG